MTRAVLRWSTGTCLMLALLGLASLQRAQAQAKTFNVPAQPATTGIPEFARQAGIQILVSEPLVRGKRIAAVTGSHSVDEALIILLQGTGLTATSNDGATYTVASARAPTTSLNGPGAAVLSSSQTNSPRASVAEAPLSPAEGDKGGASLEEIVVTAEKRSERLIDVPQSISVISANDLARLGATQFSDFANTIPGLSFATAGAGFTQISMRGVTTGYDVSSTVGIYVDDVPYGSSTTFALGNLFGLDPGLFGIDRVEVLRGPQGTLYGASAMGGLLKYVTKLPDSSSFFGDAQAGVSSTGDGGGISSNLAAAVNLPLMADKAAVRVSGYEIHDGGFIDNLARNEKNVNRSDTRGGRVDFLLTPTDPLSIRITAFLQNTTRDGEATADYTGTGAAPYGTLGQYRPYPGGEPFDERFRLVSGTVAYDFGGATLTSISGYQTLNEANTWDVSGILVGLCPPFEGFPCSSMAALSNIDMHKMTQELRLTSKANQFIEWQIGGFYTHETSAQYEYFALNDLAGVPQPNNLYTYFVPSRYTEYAAFGDATWHITNKVDVTGGIRYARDDQQFSQTGGGFLGSSKPSTDSSEDVRNYLGTARYHLSDHATAYVRYATGYRPGGPNYVTLNPTTGLPNGPATYQPDSLKSYEAGFKAESADRRFAMDLAGYHINWNNIQIATNTGGFSSIGNASGGATVEGAELSLTARPVTALTTSAAFGYTHAYMKEADAVLGATQGERLPGSPRFTASLNADYELAVGTFAPTVGGTLRHVSDRTVDFSGTRPANIQPVVPQYTVFDLRGGITIRTANLQLYVHNVFDERGQLSVILPQFGDRVAILQPRTVGVNVSTKF